jgi:hypothetical protein
MDVRKHLDGEWLKANVNVKDGDYIKFLSEGVEEPNDKDGFDLILMVGVIRNGEQIADKKFRLNKGNLKETVKVYGMNSTMWVQKEMRINVAKVKNPQGGVVDGIVLSAPNIDSVGDVVFRVEELIAGSEGVCCDPAIRL